MEPLADPIARARSTGSGHPPEGGFSALTPELAVYDLDTSLRFWCDLLGFGVAYDRPAARFSYLVRGRAQIMLCQRNGRWDTGTLERPYGRGVNFQIMVDQLAPILTALATAGWPLFEERARLGIGPDRWRADRGSVSSKTPMGISCASPRASGIVNRSKVRYQPKRAFRSRPKSVAVGGLEHSRMQT